MKKRNTDLKCYLMFVNKQNRSKVQLPKPKLVSKASETGLFSDQTLLCLNRHTKYINNCWDQIQRENSQEA